MLIDWFTVAAQVVNFIILALLLRRFLYRPVAEAIAGRKKKIADELAAADAVRQEAFRIKALYEENHRQLEARRHELLAVARQEADAEKALLMEEVRKETEEERNKLVRAFRDDRELIRHQISRMAREEVFTIARKTLTDLASRDLESYIFDEFLKHLEAPDALQEQQYRQMLISGPPAVVIRTAFGLTTAQQKAISSALNRLLYPNPVRPSFEIKPELICGVEVQINYYRLEWNISGHLHEIGTIDVD